MKKKLGPILLVNPPLKAVPEQVLICPMLILGSRPTTLRKNEKLYLQPFSRYKGRTTALCLVWKKEERKKKSDYNRNSWKIIRMYCEVKTRLRNTQKNTSSSDFQSPFKKNPYTFSIQIHPCSKFLRTKYTLTYIRYVYMCM